LEIEKGLKEQALETIEKMRKEMEELRKPKDGITVGTSNGHSHSHSKSSESGSVRRRLRKEKKELKKELEKIQKEKEDLETANKSLQLELEEVKELLAAKNKSKKDRRFSTSAILDYKQPNKPPVLVEIRDQDDVDNIQLLNELQQKLNSVMLANDQLKIEKEGLVKRVQDLQETVYFYLHLSNNNIV